MRDRGYPPTVREIGEAVGLTSSSSVHAQLANLERKGLIHKDPTKPRAMALSEPKADAITVPLRRSYRGRRPRPGHRTRRGLPRVPEGFAGDDDHFALKVAGESMIGAGHLRRRRRRDPVPGARARRRHRRRALPGPAEDEATVKRSGHEGDRVMLIPENPALEPFEMARRPDHGQGRRGPEEALSQPIRARRAGYGQRARGATVGRSLRTNSRTAASSRRPTRAWTRVPEESCLVERPPHHDRAEP